MPQNGSRPAALGGEHDVYFNVSPDGSSVSAWLDHPECLPRQGREICQRKRDRSCGIGRARGWRRICCLCPASIRRATDSAKLAIARLTGTDAPKFDDNETTIAELRARVAKTEAYLATVAPDALEGSEAREVVISPGGNKVVFRGDDYLTNFALPNFYFHVSMVHAILRNQGAPVGKLDYLGRFS
jgi:hypothetical protein